MASHDSRQNETAVRQVLYNPPRPTPDGRTVLALSPLEFLAALSRLSPPPRVHHHRYHGVRAPHARLRDRVTTLGRLDAQHRDPSDPMSGTAPDPRPRDSDPAGKTASLPAPACADSPTRAAARSRWARRLGRIYELFPLRGPECGADVRILAFLTDPDPVDAILRPLDLTATPPPLSPAHGPPQPDLRFDLEHTLDLDPMPAFDPAEPEPLRGLDLDQTRGA